MFESIIKIFRLKTRVIHLTDSIWTNEFDQKIWTWPKPDYHKKWFDELDRKISQRLKWSCEYDRNLRIPYIFFRRCGNINIKKNYFGQIQSCIFVVVEIFKKISFGQIQSLSVKLNKLTFVVVNFWSCSNR